MWFTGRESEEMPVEGWTKGDFNGDEADHVFLFLDLPNLGDLLCLLECDTTSMWTDRSSLKLAYMA